MISKMIRLEGNIPNYQSSLGSNNQRLYCVNCCIVNFFLLLSIKIDSKQYFCLWQKPNVAETCFFLDGLIRFKLRFKPLLAETRQPCRCHVPPAGEVLLLRRHTVLSVNCDHNAQYLRTIARAFQKALIVGFKHVYINQRIQNTFYTSGLYRSIFDEREYVTGIFTAFSEERLQTRTPAIWTGLGENATLCAFSKN
jgi:hypothetical protein